MAADVTPVTNSAVTIKLSFKLQVLVCSYQVLLQRYGIGQHCRTVWPGLGLLHLILLQGLSLTKLSIIALLATWILRARGPNLRFECQQLVNQHFSAVVESCTGHI
jgi:hypothetical protein